MTYFTGSDVSLRSVSICVVDDRGEVCRETFCLEARQVKNTLAAMRNPRRLAMSTVAGDNAQCIPLMR
ncbi:hypothetical protein AB4Z46_32765 [Variovorax sp. M-6]|uniref:hypothetical protein n=1 Tax=Variovorax sp. M-6 TaxID=3233041 RepID=UPI003F9636C9